MDEKQSMSTKSALVAACDEIRIAIRAQEIKCRELKKAMQDSKDEQSYQGQAEEMFAQITLAFRHLEDARMRVGKVIQYWGNGVSIYDKV